jgi:hypothetical protein
MSNLPEHAVHRHFRRYVSTGLTSSLAMARIKREHWDDWKDMAQKQEQGIIFQALGWTPEREARRMQIIQTGRLN